MLDIEEVCEGVRIYLRARLADSIDRVNAGRSFVGAASKPSYESFYVGPWSRYEVYQLPAIFVVSPVSTLGKQGNAHDDWAHEILVCGVVQDSTVPTLTVHTWRLAKAVYDCLRDVDATAEADIASSSHKLLTNGCDWGTIYRAQSEATFRSDFTLRMTAKAQSVALVP